MQLCSRRALHQLINVQALRTTDAVYPLFFGVLGNVLALCGGEPAVRSHRGRGLLNIHHLTAVRGVGEITAFRET